MTTRVLIAQAKHETNTFSRLPTDLDAYARRMLRYGEDIAPAVRGTNSELGGFLEVAGREGWRTVFAIAADATPSGKLTPECWAHIKHAILDALERQGPFDGILLALHGAMVTESTEDGEGDLLGEIRRRVGPDLPIVSTLDLHANVSDAMARAASALVTYRSYPHVDMHARGVEAAQLLGRALRGEVRPQTLVRRGPQLDGADHGRSQSGPMVELLERAERRMREPGILVVNVQAGFPWADIRDVGPSVAVTYDLRIDAAATRAAAIADEMMAFVWETRREKSIALLSPEAALARCARSAFDGRPIVLADFSDNPGGGSYGDSTALLRTMVEARIENAAFATIADAEVAAIAHRAGRGAEVRVRLGGKHDAAVSPGLDVVARVISLSDGKLVYEGPMQRGLAVSMGPTAVLRIGGVDVVVASNRFQVYDRQFFASQGIDPATRRVVAVKSAHHFRAAYEPIAREVIVVDAAGITSPDPRKFPYRNVRRPIWPLDMD
ncbi:MAG: M81 family metallopeptidase [Burkholderiales bacterium]|nr:M81 family metallopeptidase [Burkholderiales bacterium]